MKNKFLPVASTEREQQTKTENKSKVMSWTKWLSASALMSLFLLMPTESVAQNNQGQLDSIRTDSIKSAQVAPVKKSAFCIDAAYSPTDDVATFRLAGGGSVHGLNVWGFLDLSSNDAQDWINSAFGKITVSKSLDKILKGGGVAVEYTLLSEAPDKVRTGVVYRHILANGKAVFKLYPLSEKGLEPYAFLSVDQKMWNKLFASAFVGSDIKSKTYYGEAEATYQITKQIDALFQTRVGGSYTTKPQAGVYVGARVRF